MRRMGGILLTVTGFLACPCHLVITLSLLISLLAGTVLGSFPSRNTGLVYMGAAIYFVLAPGTALLFGSKREPRWQEATCSTCTSLGMSTNLNPGNPRT